MPVKEIPEKDYAAVALAFFNAGAILSLFIILYCAEKNSAEDFGKIMRDNIATIIVALLINFINASYEIFTYLNV